MFTKGCDFINFLNFEYFIVTAQEMNFTRAADKLHITQQSLSSHIARIENYFGVELFDRKTPLSLTRAGECYLKNANILLQSFENLEREIQDIKEYQEGEIIIGITRDSGAIYLPLLLPLFYQEFPHFRISLFEESADKLESALLNSGIDLMIGPLPQNNVKVKSEAIWCAEYVLVVADHILAHYLPEQKDLLLSNNTPVKLTTFEKCPFLSVRQDLRVGKYFKALCKQENISPNVLLESKDLNTLITLCSTGLGALICPVDYLYPYINSSGINSAFNLRIFSLEAHQEQILAVSRLSNKYFSLGARKFVELAIQVIPTVSDFLR